MEKRYDFETTLMSKNLLISFDYLFAIFQETLWFHVRKNSYPFRQKKSSKNDSMSSQKNVCKFETINFSIHVY